MVCTWWLDPPLITPRLLSNRVAHHTTIAVWRPLRLNQQMKRG